MAEQQELDRQQLRVLVRTNFKIDWRGASNPFDSMRTKRGRLSPLVTVLGINIFFSALIGVGFLIMPTFFDGLVIGGIGALVLVSLQVLIEFSQILISPEDYHVIAPHPVSSKTFYTAKLVHLLLYVSLLSASMSIVPAVFAAVAAKSILAPPVVLIHFWLVSVFATVLMMVFFTLVLRNVNRRRMERTMSYLQVGLIFILYTGFYILPSKLRAILSGVDAVHDPWLAALPTYWFASPVKLITHGFDWTTFGLMLLGFGLLLGLGTLALSYLSLSYAQSLTGSIETETVRTRTIPQPIRRLWYSITAPETRAVAKLAWAQFKHDNAFRIQVLWVVPITLFALLYGYVKEMHVIDPLAAVRPDGVEFGSGAMLGLLAIMAPLMVHVGMVQSKTWRAAWVFHALPVDRTRLVLASKCVVVMIVVGPIGLFLAAVYSYLFDSIPHGVLHAAFVGALTAFGLSLIGLVSVRVPFGTEKAYGGFTAESLVVFAVAWIVMGVPIGIVGEIGYGGYLGWAIWMGSVLLLTTVVGYLQRAKIRAKVREWEF